MTQMLERLRTESIECQSPGAASLLSLLESVRKKPPAGHDCIAQDLFAGIQFERPKTRSRRTLSEDSRKDEVDGCAKRTRVPARKEITPSAASRPVCDQIVLREEEGDALTTAMEKARQSQLGSIVPAAEFHAGTRVDGRPSRRRFPVLQHWKNEHLVYERPRGSEQPVVSAVEFKASPVHHIDSPRRLRQNADASGFSEVLASKRPRRRRQDTDSSSRSRVNDGSLGDAILAEEAVDGSSETRSCLALCGTGLSSLRHARRLTPVRSALRRPGRGPTSSHVSPKSIHFSAEQQEVAIENFSEDADDLWYQGFAVECDRCDQPVSWGLEGSLLGAAGISRFAQWQVLCGSCLADKLYAEIGAWLVVGMVAGDTNEDHNSWHVALRPIVNILDMLAPLNLNGKPDQLVALLGEQALNPEVRETVLKRARGNAQGLLKGKGEKPSKSDETHEDAPDTSSN